MALVFQYLTNQEKEMKDKYGTFFDMVVASRDILQYHTIQPTDIDVIKVPKSMVPPGLIQNAKDVIDTVAAVPISSGEQILDSKILSRNVYSGLDTQVAMGKRAFSIAATIKNSENYLLHPGDRVDLASHFEYKTEGSSISEVKVFLQDVLVLAVGRTIQPEPPKGVDQELVQLVYRNRQQFSEGLPANAPHEPTPDMKDIQDTVNYAKQDTQYATVTLELTPFQVQEVLYVMNAFGEISVLLRHETDREIASLGTSNLMDVMGQDSFYVRGRQRPSLPKKLPKIRYFDYLGGQKVPIYE